LNKNGIGAGMRNQDAHLSQSQQRFLNVLLAEAGKEAVGKKFDLVNAGGQRYLQREQNVVPVMLSDTDLLHLSRSGYLNIYATTTPVSIVFTELVLVNFTEKGVPEESHNERVSDAIVRMDMVQVYAWLIASLIAALFFLFLLWLTVQQALQQHFSASVAAAIVDLISGSLTVVFFNNWNKANQHLSHLRSGRLPAIKSQEINK
jgi:hypothetical protein